MDIEKKHNGVSFQSEEPTTQRTAPTPGENQQYSITGKILLRTLTLTFITILILAVSASVGAGILCLLSIFWTSNRVSLFFVNLKAITLKTF